MNLRFSSKDVRLRINLQEALLLKEAKHFEEIIYLPENQLSVRITIDEHLSSPATFSFMHNTAAVFLRESDFSKLLADRPSRDSAIIHELSYEQKLSFIFEIDLFTRKGSKES